MIIHKFLFMMNKDILKFLISKTFDYLGQSDTYNKQE